ncbi:hypothetical protein MHC_01200 [Mycoplasma haemocanis str. Illinois]|uniref:Uncharacterized protein n=1 Tax=Mycoplasma haemocanis (strain Illinois) TaxID=1111676 RepID=H6N634_MYCHN|nr:hypothetical protein [Mycoplasma haemocanis]AEW45106.1 hypothetical protein MHC_01200 [Mycoplasma haemocanis str. Illinois]
MNFVSKAVAGVGLTGSFAGGGYLIYIYNNKTTLEDRLLKDKFKILPLKAGKENNEGWSAVLTEYKKDTIPSQYKFSIPLDATSDDANIEKLKTECSKVLSGKYSDSSYSKAKRWCVVVRSLKERLEDTGFRVLDNSEGSNNDDSEWIKKESVYRDGDLSGIENDLTTAAGDKSKRKVAIKKGCKSLLEGDSKTFSDGFDDKYSKAEKLCAIRK